MPLEHALDRVDVIEAGTNRIAATVKFYFGLVGWLYVREILSALLMLPIRHLPPIHKPDPIMD